MDIRTLKHFITLSETLHFGRASKKANISTSALSRNIRRLETELGTVLFDRDNRTVTLTSEGRTFLTYAHDAVQRWDQIRYDLIRAGTPPQEPTRQRVLVVAPYRLNLSGQSIASPVASMRSPTTELWAWPAERPLIPSRRGAINASSCELGLR